MATRFRFKKTDVIGYMDAEADDQDFLHKCFIDIGLLGVVSNCDDPRIILASRTGAGKSALISRLKETQANVIEIEPKDLEITYIATSRTFQFFAHAGLNMHDFFRLYWRHLISAEILRQIVGREQLSGNQAFIDRIISLLPREQRYREAVDFLDKWGGFWEEVNIRMREISESLEHKLQDSVAAEGFRTEDLSRELAENLSEKEKAKVVERGHAVIDQIRVREFGEVLNLIDALISKRREKIYIAFDDLDRDWVEDRFRFLLIRELITTATEYSHIKNVKIVVALRYDLLDRIYRYTRDPGFQEEKIRARYLNVEWTRSQLTQFLDRRIEFLFERAGVRFKNPVTHKTVLRDSIGNTKAIDYIIDRTLMRPRDVIAFLNACISLSVGKSTISSERILAAEGEYSTTRLTALQDEWIGIFPNLIHLSQILTSKPDNFLYKEIDKDAIVENMNGVIENQDGAYGVDYELVEKYFKDKININQYIKEVVMIFYKVGLVGLKPIPEMGVSWAGPGQVNISEAQVHGDTRVFVHKAYWRTLGIGEGK